MLPLKFQLCTMCTSKCSGTCMTLLKDQKVNSEESLTELNNLINKITVCAVPADTDKNAFMSEVFYLKEEARKLLDEVNYHGERSPDGKLIFASSCGFHNILDDTSIKERLNDLRRKINALSSRPLSLK